LIGLLTAVPGEGDGKGVVEWPPDPRVIEAAGGVGFGCLDNREEEEEDEEEEGSVGSVEREGERRKQNGSAQGGHRHRPLRVEEVAIPPMIRQMHPKLKLPAYRRYGVAIC
jgi:hypothetical protein